MQFTIPEKPLTSLLEEAAAQYPENTAIFFYGTVITYREFDRQVKKVMNILRGLGVGEGDTVAIMAPNCPQGLIAYQAVLRLGAVVTQTNPLYVEREIEAQFNDAGVKVAFVLNLFANRVMEVAKNTELEKLIVLNLADYMPWPVSGPLAAYWSELVNNASDEAQSAKISPDQTALLQYTGGTTGTAKGVRLTHRNVLSNALQCRQWFLGAQPGKEVFILALPTFHAFGMTTGLNLALSLGAEMALVPKFEADAVMKLIEKRRATIFPGVPAMYVAVNNHPKAAKRDISSIKFCVSGAAPLPLEVKERFEKLTGGKLVEGYGLTEASPCTHCNPLDGSARPGSIGLPLPGTKSLIVKSEDGEECPQGEVGEMIVNGPQVMAGYHGKPEETARVLKNGWLFTGDMGYVDADGYVFLMDRKKEMIISGGCNVYPKEVEDILYQCPGVMEAAVVGMDDSYLGERVVAAVVKKPGAQVTAEDITAYCRKNMASYKAPKKIVFRDSLPKTVIGKVLKRVLKEELGRE